MMMMMMMIHALLSGWVFRLLCGMNATALLATAPACTAW
jgi:hypothetical protein